MLEGHPQRQLRATPHLRGELIGPTWESGSGGLNRGVAVRVTVVVNHQLQDVPVANRAPNNFGHRSEWLIFFSGLHDWINPCRVGRIAVKAHQRHTPATA